LGGKLLVRYRANRKISDPWLPTTRGSWDCSSEPLDSGSLLVKENFYSVLSINPSLDNEEPYGLTVNHS
jgi:hypothetical protein